MPAPFDILPFLLQGARTTLVITLFSMMVALPVAFAAGLARAFGGRVLRTATMFYVEVFRGTSAIVQLFWIFFVLPFFGVRFSPFLAGIMALGLNLGAYASEVVRGAVLAIPRGQAEAALALNMSSMHTLRRIILPQAFPIMLPLFGNNLIEMVKMSSLVSLITVSDLAFRADTLRKNHPTRITEVFVLILLIYFAINFVLTRGVRRLERRFAWRVVGR